MKFSESNGSPQRCEILGGSGREVPGLYLAIGNRLIKLYSTLVWWINYTNAWNYNIYRSFSLVVDSHYIISILFVVLIYLSKHRCLFRLDYSRYIYFLHPVALPSHFVSISICCCTTIVLYWVVLVILFSFVIKSLGGGYMHSRINLHFERSVRTKEYPI